MIIYMNKALENMILKKNMSFRGLSEFRPDHILTAGNQRPPGLCPPLIFNHFNPIQVVFYLVTIDHNFSTVPPILIHPF